MPRAAARARATYAVDLVAAASGCLVAPRLLGPLAPTEIMIVLGLVRCVLALMRVAHRRRPVAVIALIAVAHVSLLVIGRAGDLPDGPLQALLDSILCPRRPSSKRARTATCSRSGRQVAERTGLEPAASGVTGRQVIGS